MEDGLDLADVDDIDLVQGSIQESPDLVVDLHELGVGQSLVAHLTTVGLVNENVTDLTKH